MDAAFGRWASQILIAGLTHEALIASCVMKGAMDGPAFTAWVPKVLIPEVAPGPAVVLNNLATHRHKEAAAAHKAHGFWFRYLRPYSPDLNSIELTSSKLKAHLRRISARSFTSVFEANGDIREM